MAITVKKIVESTTARQTESGWEATDFYMVKGIATPAQSSYLAPLNVPVAIGQPHDFIPNAKCISKGVSEIHGTGENVTVEVHYGQPGGGGSGDINGDAVLQTGSQLELVTSNRSITIDGSIDKIIEVAFKPDGAADDPNSPGTGEITIARPRGIITYTRRESSHPLDKAIKFTGYLNSTAWPSGTSFNGVEKWMCTGINGFTDDAGLTYTVTYEFLYKEEGHHQMVVFTDPVTGVTPTTKQMTDPPNNNPGAAGNGTLIVRVAGIRNFNELQLT